MLLWQSTMTGGYHSFCSAARRCKDPGTAKDPQDNLLHPALAAPPKADCAELQCPYTPADSCQSIKQYLWSKYHMTTDKIMLILNTFTTCTQIHLKDFCIPKKISQLNKVFGKNTPHTEEEQTTNTQKRWIMKFKIGQTEEKVHST